MTLLESIRNLPAKSESQQMIKSQALQISMELGRARWQMHGRLQNKVNEDRALSVVHRCNPPHASARGGHATVAFP